MERKYSFDLRVGYKLWVWGDTHFGHRNIVQFQQRPGTHEVIMLSNWIDRVGEHDQILHLGDVALGQDGNRKRWLKVVKRMPGQKFLILGNHDKEAAKEYENAGFQILDPFIALGVYFRNDMIENVAFTHFPHSTTNPAPAGGWGTNIHGHIHKNALRPMDGYIDPNKRYINLSVENTDLAPVQLGNVLLSKRYDTAFIYEEEENAARSVDKR